MSTGRDNAAYVRPLGSAVDGVFGVAVTPTTSSPVPGWRHTTLRVATPDGVAIRGGSAGAALYTHKAFGLHFVTFLVAFTVVCSGITSASTSSNLLAANLLAGLDETIGNVPTGTTATTVALGNQK